ncbi:hypothetical protein BaRGS_00013244 [Batillaria attramentaria]|uniref:E3 ubiquitin-protein ligase CHFR n=1 Tax=Batillaria attramentaria TaxID=370345 RepID=A0ABD0L8F6_9CAEN
MSEGGDGSTGDSWAQLVCVTDTETPPLMIGKDKFTIGRARGCDVCHENNKLVSGTHCYILRDETGKVWLYDSSTNGTLLNLKHKLTKGECREIFHGDEFFVVFKKGDDDLNIGYVFQDMARLKEEEAAEENDGINVAQEDEPRPPIKRRLDQGQKDAQQEKDVTKGVLTKSEDAASSAKVADSKVEEGGGGEGGDAKDGAKDDAFAETLTCIICQELLHDCISLQPCMHSFCAGCYSEWMEQSSECPSCRMSVDRINKNHIVNNLVEAYLKEHPDKRRPEEDIKELDAKNKITRDMLYPKRKRRNSSDYSDSDEDNSDDHYDPDPLPLPVPPAAPHGVVFGFGTPGFGAASNAYRAVCRQCPGSMGASGAGNILGKGDGAGDVVDRDEKVMPTPPQFQCAPNQNHVLCQCCLQIFPDRRLERNNNPDLPPQQCTICFRAFCHAYWGCRKVDCNGCLAKLKDMKFGKKVLTSLILDNPYESEILKNYLESKGLAVQDVLEACLAKMQEGKYTCPDQARYNMNGETPLCYACALRNFKALAYQYRFDIPRDDLPAEVTARPDCYWGKNCRTQKNRPPHAQRFNHICNQTRT